MYLQQKCENTKFKEPCSHYLFSRYEAGNFTGASRNWSSWRPETTSSFRLKRKKNCDIVKKHYTSNYKFVPLYHPQEFFFLVPMFRIISNKPFTQVVLRIHKNFVQWCHWILYTFTSNEWIPMPIKAGKYFKILLTGKISVYKPKLSFCIFLNWCLCRKNK